MKTIYSIALLLLGAINLQAQQLQARLSSELKYEKSVFHGDIIGVAGNKIYALASRVDKKNVDGGLYGQMTVIDAKTMTLMSSVPIAVPDKASTLLSTRMLKGQPWIFTRVSSRKAGVDFIKAYKLDLKTGEVNPKEYPIAEFIDKKNLKISTWLPKEASVNILTSSDSSKFCLLVEANTERKEHHKSYVKVFDAKTMTPLWEQTIEIPFPKYRYELKVMNLTNQGEMEFLGKMYDTDKLKESVSKTEAAYKYVAYLFDGTNTKGSDYILDLGGKFVTKITSRTRPDNGNYVIMGLYADKRNITVNGLYYMEIEKNTGKVVDKYMTTIAADKIKYLPKAVFEKKENGLTYIATMDGVLFKKNGDFTFIIGTDYTVTSSDGKGNSSSYFKTYGSIAIGVSKTGEMQWGTAMPRDFSSSFADVAFAPMFFKNDCLFMVYNDSEANAKTPVGEKIKHSHSNKKGATVTVKVDANGKLSRRLLLSEQTLDGHAIKTNDGIQLSTNEYVFAARKYNLLKGTASIKMCRLSFVD
jgi:hypothetical protein